jgi:large subunit ribosomal protein L16
MAFNNFKLFRKSKLKNFKYNSQLNFGKLGLKALESGVLNLKQIESAKKVLTKKTQRQSKIWIKVSFNLALTKKPLGIRMGKGKGKINFFYAKIKKGSIIFEISGSNNKQLRVALKACSYKLPVKTSILTYLI